MKTYVAVLGRQPLVSLAELESLCEKVQPIATNLATFETDAEPQRLMQRLGGTLKIAEPITEPIAIFWEQLPQDGKIVLGVSDFSRGAKAFGAQKEALRWKKFLTKLGRSVRVVPNRTAEISSATSLHNRLFTDTHIELLKLGKNYYRVRAVQDIEAYVRRDQARPARDAKVGMLPPKLAQILINLCGNLPTETRLLDPFCGTGVVLQEAALMGYVPYGTDLSARMVQYSDRNLRWLERQKDYLTQSKSLATEGASAPVNPIVAQNVQKVNSKIAHVNNSLKFEVAEGDAQNYTWQPPINAVACETYLGPPMSTPPVEIKLRQAKQDCKTIIVGFLKNLAEQIKSGTPVVIAVPAWLRPNGEYERLNLLDEIDELRYNVVRFKNVRQKDLLYHRDGQVVAREIIVLRKN